MAETIEGFFLMIGILIMSFVYFVAVAALMCFWVNKISEKYELVFWVLIIILYFLAWSHIDALNAYTKKIDLPALVRVPTVTYMFFLPLILLAFVIDAVGGMLGYKRTMRKDDFCS